MTSANTAPAEQGGAGAVASSAPVIEALNLRKVYPARHGHPPVTAIEDVSFEVQPRLANIAFGLEMLKRFSRAEIKARAEHYVEHLGLAGFANAYPATLSGGMKQRVAIARTLATQPEFILMDEPFASLDAQTRDRLIVDVSGIASEHNTTFLFVTHDVREAIRLADRIVVFSPRPARIVESVEIALPRPRDAYGSGLLEVERYLRSLIGKSAEG